MDLKIELFLQEYKKLVVMLYSSPSEIDLLNILLTSTGLNILPSLLFDKSGTLKSKKELFKLAHQQLKFFIKENTHSPVISKVLLINIKRCRQKQQAWSEPPQTKFAQNVKWFKFKYGRSPKSTRHIRKILLITNQQNLAPFINFKRMRPWQNLNHLLSYMRTTSKRVHM
jgi:hypothetical protein